MRYFLIIAIFLACRAHAQDNNEMKTSLNGQVKSIKESEYALRKNGKKKHPSKSVIHYDKKGLETEVITHNRHGKLSYKLKYTYENGRRVAGDESLKHDKNGIHYYYGYDTNGYLIEEDELLDNNIVNKHLFTYDRKGRQEKFESYNQDGELEFRTENKFDGNDNIAEENYYNADGLEFKLKYTYDDKGNELELVYYQPDGGLDHKLSYKYERYDAQGNWLKETTFENDRPVSTTEREIEYY